MSRSSSRSRNNLPSTSARIRIASDISEREHDREGPLPSSLSLLSARRPSWAPAPYDSHNSQDRIIAGLASYRDVPTLNVPNQAGDSSSPEIDGGNFRRNLHIDMKDLVGDAVGNMSISPVGRDIVLAARRGLFIIDLEAPLEVPRFLPQGGTWEVADVQWNPHRVRAEYIVSTSSEKLLIWNLLMPGKMSIEHILRSHYRAITDINWHTFEPEIVSSVGIDSWIWTWDLRETRKPVLGLCAFNAGGTQVKWNRQDANVLASSHMNEVLIWDRRKGSLPTARIRAHNAKIYGIDWAHARVSDIVTCSLDKTIKVWNVKEAISTEMAQQHPLTTITTRYPVWRARDLPFGRGVLSLPQRGETILEMWAQHNPLTPAEVFEGHEDVVKEFVWRKSSIGGEYQLISWSKDRTLRFWHVGPDIMEKFGWKPGFAAAEAQPQNLSDHRQSFRHPPQSLDHVPTLSAPIGSRSILAEVRAGRPPPSHKPTNPVLQPHHGSAARGKGILLLEPGAAASFPRGHTVQSTYGHNHRPVPIPTTTITRGKAMGGRSARVDPFAWLASVRVENRRDGSSSSRVSSGSTASPQRENNATARNGKRKRSPSKVRENKDGDGEQSLWPEITSVLTKLTPSNKIRLEKHELTKRRTCTIGLHGPWGESSSVFVRVSFRFPKGYPHAPHPEGTPEVELERTPLISLRTRAFMLRKLRAMRERHRPCLEACLRFLLFGDEDDQVSASTSSEPSSEDEGPGQLPPKSRNFTASVLRNNNNLAEPRTSQGVFGPNGELVCFFWSPPREARNSEVASSTTHSLSPPSSRPLFQPPALLSDAIRRLALAAVDQQSEGADFRRSNESDHTLRIMTNLLTFSGQKSRHNSDGHPVNDGPSHYAAPVMPACRSTVYIRLPDDVSFFRRKVAAAYVFGAVTLPGLCATNARIAHEHGQLSHERVFRTLESLLLPREASASFNIFTVAGLHIIEKLHKQFCVNYDIQMLAMIAVILLKAYARVSVPVIRRPSPKELPSAASKTDDDYFSLPAVKDPRAAVLSPGWPRLSSISPTGPSAPTAASLLSTSNSSRGSWSSLFNTGTVRQLMSGVQESTATSLDTTSPRPPPAPIPIGDIVPRLPNPDSPRRKALGKDPSPSSTTPLSKSWSESHVIPLSRPSLSQSSNQARRPAFSQVVDVKQGALQKKLVIVEKEPESKESTRAFLQPDQLARLACHIVSYAEVLLKWQLDSKRLELLNAVKTSEFVKTPPVSQREFGFDVQPTCKRCGHKQATNVETCSFCGARPGKPSCSICRLPVKGLSIWCGQCLHISHVKCWRDTQSNVCGSGCGCPCGGPRKPSSRQDPSIHSPSPLVV
ncbi:hypothetical protein F5J12DRAFT_795392 [Pisolithus orientalis]|uniref:uncharacterized protein n=1 Tax=Pisolithus orientalis TaxID=936130 RepID=UPI002224695A|nr:uncharacterized protein F5J12DRAFT_795392 [Pisolithus orientalis]KAI6032602.1 hypothetical protein F5J12DRAFT_795392 [Pisolithus orientalis]